ncbi:GPP34 family phosphoprotein [Streptomyces thermolineatus]|uniref:GPP34 family phosphoprotein n=1 Tax=Streptomyces thermolineatus TaxID=44033 RepID=A0ABP5ZZA0_9ACTN
MPVTLGEEIMLLSLDDGSGRAEERQAAAWSVAGGTLLELVAAGRVVVEDERLRVVDPSPTGVPLLDGRLEQIAAWTERKGNGKVAAWITKDRTTAVQATAKSLADRGLVREEQRRVLGLFPVRRYPEADGSVERELRSRLAAVVLENARPDERTAGLVALLHAANLHRIAFPDLPRKAVKARMEEIAEGHWAGDSVRKAIRIMQSTVAVVTVTTAG